VWQVINDNADVFYLAVTFFTLGWCISSTRPLQLAAILLLVDFVLSNFVYYLEFYDTVSNIIMDAGFALAFVCLWAYYEDKIFLWMLGLTVAVIVWHFGNEFLIEIERFWYLLGINILFFLKATYIWKVRYAT